MTGTRVDVNQKIRDKYRYLGFQADVADVCHPAT